MLYRQMDRPVQADKRLKTAMGLYRELSMNLWLRRAKEVLQ